MVSTNGSSSLLPMLGDYTPPWEKMPNETAKAYGAFIAYRNLPAHERSLKRAVGVLFGDENFVKTSSKLRQFQTWSAQYSWVSRAAAWDEDIDRRAREDQVKAVKEMRTRQVKLAQAMQQKAIERLRSMEAAELDADQVLAYIMSSSKLEAQALGEPPETLRVNGMILNLPVDYTKVSDEELREFIVQQMRTNNTPGLPGAIPPTPIETGIDELPEEEDAAQPPEDEPDR